MTETSTTTAPVLPAFYGNPIDTPAGHRWVSRYSPAERAAAVRRESLKDDGIVSSQHGPRCLTEAVDGECVCR